MKGGIILKLDKKTALAMSIIATILIVCISAAIAFGTSRSKDAKDTKDKLEILADTQTKEETKTETTVKKKYVYNNIDGLYFIASKDHEMLKESIEKYLLKNDIYITHITITDKVETEDENFYAFWILLDSSILIRGNYNYELSEYSFTKETDDKIISGFIDTSIPDDEDVSNDVYGYMDLNIENLEEIEPFLSKEDLARLTDELVDFLDLHHELRRLFKVYDIKENADSVSWIFLFETPRIDDKNVLVTYVENIFEFTLK